MRQRKDLPGDGMPTYVELIGQIGELTEALAQAVAEELRLSATEARSQIDELTTELDRMRLLGEEAVSGRQRVERSLETAEKRIEDLVQKLKEARQSATEAATAAREEFQQRLESLESNAAAARQELEQERSIRKRLEKGAAADERRLTELEKALEDKALADKAPENKAPEDKGTVPWTDKKGREGANDETVKLRTALKEALAELKGVRRVRQELEDEVAEAHNMIEALEKALKQSQESPRGGGGASEEEVAKLTEKLHVTQLQLEKEQLAGKNSASACAAAERRVEELEEALRGRPRPGHSLAPADAEGSVHAVKKSASETPLPHELRPAPKPGVLFRPDWDLEGLPCKSAEQVLQAWGSVSNVQLSLEGYPSQYCAAFLVVLKHGKQKQLVILFNLKGSKHTLVCVPSKSPADEAALDKAVGEGQKYLQMSGFELDKIAPPDVSRILGGYFLKA
jgi:hypothetical protein